MAVDMFLKLDGIKGESQDAKHKEEIDVISWTWGMTQEGASHQGPGGGAGKVNVKDLSITKYVDKATPNLLKWCCKGTHIKEALLSVRKAGGNPVEYLKIKMFEVLVSSAAPGGNASGDRLTETIMLNFGYFEVEYTPQKADGSADASIPMSWYIKGNTEKKS